MMKTLDTHDETPGIEVLEEFYAPDYSGWLVWGLGAAIGLASPTAGLVFGAMLGPGMGTAY